MIITEIIKEWEKGCSCTTPHNLPPSECQECTLGAIRAIRKITLGGVTGCCQRSYCEANAPEQFFGLTECRDCNG